MIEQLRATPLLSRLNEAQLQRVAARASIRRLGEDEWLFRQGSPARHLYLVEQGLIRLFRISPEGDEKVIEIVSPGQTFAEALTFMNAPRYPVCAAALEASRVVAIDAADFSAMLRESVDTCFVVLAALSQRLRALIGEIDNLTLHTATSRVARYLLAHCPEDRRAFALDIPKGVLASRLSIKPETFSRVTKQLKQGGIISVTGAHITLLDREALVGLAELQDVDELEPLPCPASTPPNR
jgi:CRP-like cAMP-binding protein